MISSTAPKQNLLSVSGITLEWEDQQSSSALYIKYDGRVIGIRATISKVQRRDDCKMFKPTAFDSWEILDGWTIDPEQPKYRGPVGKAIGAPWQTDDRQLAKEFVHKMIKDGTLTMECVLEGLDA